jgi:hypothetical protein
MHDVGKGAKEFPICGWIANWKPQLLYQNIMYGGNWCLKGNHRKKIDSSREGIWSDLIQTCAYMVRIICSQWFVINVHDKFLPHNKHLFWGFFLRMCYWKTFGFFPFPFLVHNRSTPKFYCSIKCQFLHEEHKAHVVQINNKNHYLIQDWIFKIKLYWVHLSLNFGEMVPSSTTQGWVSPQFNIPCNFD